MISQEIIACSFAAFLERLAAKFHQTKEFKITVVGPAEACQNGTAFAMKSRRRA
jgi:hypothetical protein